MNDPQWLSEMDQLTSSIVDTKPAFLWSFYRRLRSEGFSERQAFILTIEEQRLISSMYPVDGGEVAEEDEAEE